MPTDPAKPDVVIILTDEERAAPTYENDEIRQWRSTALPGRRWFHENGVTFEHHYTGSLACVPSRPTLFTGQYPDVHGVTQTDGLGKDADDRGMRWMRSGEVPTLGNWFRAGGYDTHYVGKWHISHADLIDPETGAPLATNDDDGVIDHAAVKTYLDADQLDPFGFSGWIGPEPHGGALANSGLRRDPIYVERVEEWLTDRYERRAKGDPEAQKPFLLVASFVNPHDICLFPGWLRRDPLGEDQFETPDIPPSPTDDETLATKPAAQAAYRDSYPTGYAPIADGVYEEHSDDYRRLYYRLHAVVDDPIDRVRRAVTEHSEHASGDAVLVLSSDHGDLLGAHGGLHQKWFNLYDEATRVPFQIARVGKHRTTGGTVATMPTSHVDLVPTLLDAAGLDIGDLTQDLASRFSELHPFPGHSLMPLVGGDSSPRDRTVYLMTRDNIMDGDTGASVVARAFGVADDPPDNMLIEVPANVASNFEAIVTMIEGEFWKLVRTFDDPDTWAEPGVRHLAKSVPGAPQFRTEKLDDEWELYNLSADPIEVHNRWGKPVDIEVQVLAVQRLNDERTRCVPPRNSPWPYVNRM